MKCLPDRKPDEHTFSILSGVKSTSKTAEIQFTNMLENISSK